MAKRYKVIKLIKSPEPKALFFIAFIFFGLFITLIQLSPLKAQNSWAKRKEDQIQISGRPIQIKDGDSFVMRQNNIRLNSKYKKTIIEVRLASIDAPEYYMPFGRECRRQLENLIIGQTIILVPITNDRYGRIVGVAKIANRNINREMVRNGCAWAYRRYLYDREMIALEQAARREKIGLWSQEPSKIIPPWQQRKH